MALFVTGFFSQIVPIRSLVNLSTISLTISSLSLLNSILEISRFFMFKYFVGISTLLMLIFNITKAFDVLYIRLTSSALRVDEISCIYNARLV